MPQAIVLGSGTSNGVPMLGYRYPPGYLDEPKNWRTRSSLLLEGPDGAVLVDCAPELRLQLAREHVYDVAATLITHSHADHVMGMDDLRSICMLYDRTMPIYALPEYHADIRRIFPYAFTEPPAGLVYPRFELREAEPRLSLGGLELRTFPVWHGAIRVLGVRAGDLAYITDVNLVPPEAEAELLGLETLVVDGLRYKPHPNHFNLEAALAFIERVRPAQAFLTHLTHDYDHYPSQAALPAGVGLAYDGLRIPFSS